MSGNQPMENQLQEIEQAKIQLLEIITKLQPHEPCDMSQREHMFGDCQEFTKVYLEKNEKQASGKIDRKFIRKMVLDELDELDEAKDVTEEVDALLDMVYYILQHLATTPIDIRPIWKLIHKANMTKFGPGGYLRDDGKWMKPPGFVPPDAEIRQEIERQLKTG